MLTPANGKLEIELRGDLAGILALSKAGEVSTFSTKERALQIKLVAGIGFEPMTFRL
jgi:site-specific DNA recombinase